MIHVDRNELVNEKHVSEAVADKIGTFVNLSGDKCLLSQLSADPLLSTNQNAQLALRELQLLQLYCEKLSIGQFVSFDMSLARGLDYYTGEFGLWTCYIYILYAIVVVYFVYRCYL